MIKRPGVQKLSFDIAYNFPQYFSDIYTGKYSPLQKKNITISIYDKNARTDKKKYAKETVWYGRKGGRIVYKEEMTLLDKN